MVAGTRRFGIRVVALARTLTSVSVGRLFLMVHPNPAFAAAPRFYPFLRLQLVTSLTTAVSFLVNASSHFPAVQSFGVFSAVLVSFALYVASPFTLDMNRSSCSSAQYHRLVQYSCNCAPPSINPQPNEYRVPFRRAIESTLPR